MDMEMGDMDMGMSNDSNTTLGLSHETLNVIDMYQYGFACLVDLFILLAYPLHFYRWLKYPERRIAFAILMNMIVWTGMN